MPPIHYVLNITVSHTAPTGKPLYIRNETKRTRVVQKMDASGIVIYDLANLPTGVSNGDRIVCFIVGEENMVSDAHTVDTTKGGTDISFTGVDESATLSPKIEIG